MKHNYYITGISGTGKSTIAKELKKYGFEVYDVDLIEGLCHWRNKETKQKAKYSSGVGKDWLDAHEWICDEEMLKRLLQKNSKKEVIVVGITANQENYFYLFDKIILLYCSEETIIRRLNSRKENNFGKNPSEQKQILGWYENFQRRVIGLGAIPINTDFSLKEIVVQIRKVL